MDRSEKKLGEEHTGLLLVYVRTCLVEKAFAVFDHSFLPFRIGYPISRLGGRSK